MVPVKYLGIKTGTCILLIKNKSPGIVKCFKHILDWPLWPLFIFYACIEEMDFMLQAVHNCLCMYWGNGFHAAGSTQLFMHVLRKWISCCRQYTTVALGGYSDNYVPFSFIILCMLTLHNAILCSSADETRSSCQIYDADTVLNSDRIAC